MSKYVITWEILVNLLESFFLLIFFEDKLTKTKRFSEKLSLLLKVIFLVFESIRTDIFNYYSIRFDINYIICFFIIMLFSCVFYDDKITCKVFFSSIYLAILLVADTVASSFPITVFHTQLDSVMVGGQFRIIVTLLYIACIGALVFISHFIRWKNISMSPIETILYIVLCAIGFFFGQYIAVLSVQSLEIFNNNKFTNKLTLVSAIYSFLFLVLLTYIYILNSTKVLNQRLNSEKQQLLLEEKDYRNLIESTESLRNLKHDMQHHLSYIKMLTVDGDLNALNEYINSYIGTLEDMHKFVTTGNSAIDCILSTNIQKAEDLGIEVNYSLSVPDTFKLDPILTSSLLGNLWTNAICACKKLIEDNTETTNINFYIKPIENMLLISIENTYNGIVKKDSNGYYLSTKNECIRGIGLKRIYEIVEQNDGIMEITDDNNIFCVHIMFPLKEITYEDSCFRR